MKTEVRGILVVNKDIVFHKGTLPFPFAKATEVNGVLYLSGQVAMTESAEPVYGSVSEQTTVIFNNIASTLNSLGSDLSRIYKVTVWLSDMAHFHEFNREYARWFTGNYPARTVVSASLAFDLDVEIEVQALALS